MHHSGSAFSVHLQGMWVAFSLAASLIAYFVARVAKALRQREEELARVQALAARAERLASLTTLSAGAAHELGTPLGTIAIASKELELALRDSEVAADARLIRSEVERCRSIVQKMGARAGSLLGELPAPSHAADAFARCKTCFSQEKASRIVVGGLHVTTFSCAQEGLVQVLVNLIQNALQAYPPDTPGEVELSSDLKADMNLLHVRDTGVGIDKDILARVGEPFFTTRAPGEGMGLGVFLARTFAEQWGGFLEIESHPGTGTRITLALPHGKANA
jgi:two-component system, sensor histidine kinase RegB